MATVQDWSVCDQVVVACDRDGLEPGMNLERFHQVADVIPHRLAAEVELPRDLIGRTAVLE
jgi:hypothetical protein